VSVWNPQGLYAVTDPDLLPGDRLYQAVEAALIGGASLVQYRDKQASPQQRLERAQRLQALCQQYQCPLLINDDIALALSVGAAGVHLGRSDGSLVDARRRLGPDAIIGATCHDSLAFAREAKTQGASYIAFGSFFPSRIKPDAPVPPLSLIQEAKREFGLPVVAIGGITLENAPTLQAAGADLLAVITGLFAAPDVTQRAREFGKLFA